MQQNNIFCLYVVSDVVRRAVHVFLVKITELKCEYSYVAMW
jgi:hypothetical protein